MKIISDIRLYKSSDVDKYVGLTNKSLIIAVRRVVMKLREQKFSLGEFDHLYVNFTVCIPEDKIELVDKIDSYHSWYRYCNVGVNQYDYEKLNVDTDYVFEKLKLVLLNTFSKNENTDEIIKTSFFEAQKGEKMLMLFKEKKTEKAKATIYLQLLDSGKYLPLLCVVDSDNNEILSEDLPETIDLNSIGEIQLSGKKVTVKPRKNALASALKPISFEL